MLSSFSLEIRATWRNEGKAPYFKFSIFWRVPTDTGKNYATQRRMEFAEASAKTSEQVNAAFIALARKLMKKKDA